MFSLTKRSKTLIVTLLAVFTLLSAALPASAVSAQVPILPSDTVIQVGAPNLLAGYAEMFGCNVVSANTTTLGYSYFGTMFGSSLNNTQDPFVYNYVNGFTSDTTQYTTVGWSVAPSVADLSTLTVSGTHGPDGTGTGYESGPDLFMGPLTAANESSLENDYGYSGGYFVDPQSGMSLKTVAGIESAVTTMASGIQTELTAKGETTRYGQTVGTVATNYNNYVTNLISSINSLRGSSTRNVIYITGGSANSWAVSKTGSSFFNSYLSQIGATNVGTSTGSMTDAQLLAAPSGTILVTDSPALTMAVKADSTLNTTYNNTQAKQNLYTLPTGAYKWSDSSAEFPLTILWLAKKLYPDSLNGSSGISLQSTMSDFYTTYYHLTSGTTLDNTIDSIKRQSNGTEATNYHAYNGGWVSDAGTLDPNY